MHEALAGGAPGEFIVFVQRQGIHVGAQANHARSAGLGQRRLLTTDERHHTRATDPGVDLVHAAQAQRLHYALCGVVFFKSQFGVGVQIAPKGGELGVELGNVRKDRT